MSQIPIYKAEKRLHIADEIQASACIKYQTDLVLKKKDEVINLQAAQAFAKKQPDYDELCLHYLESILASVGCNGNDDIFIPKETWRARNTAKDKPFNISHNPREVRGHMTDSYAIGTDLKMIPDDTAIDELPSKFHIFSGAVLYKFTKSPDTKLEEEMAQIIAEIKEGKWKVSMECLIADFDYGLMDKSDKLIIVPRNEESSFLSEYLFAYGGKGEYEGYKIGRVLKDFVFSGKGLVKEPANPESIIFANMQNFNESVYKLFSNESIKEEESHIMAATEVELLNTQVKQLEASIKAATEKNTEYEKQLRDLDAKQVKEKFDALQAEIKAKDEKLAALTAQVKTEQDTRLAKEKELAEATTKLTELNDKFAKTELEAKQKERSSKWAEKTGDTVEVSAKVVEKMVKLSDEDFDAVLATRTKPEVKKEEEVKKEQATAELDALKNAKPEEKTAPLATDGVKDNSNRIAAMGEFIGKNFFKQKPVVEAKA